MSTDDSCGPISTSVEVVRRCLDNIERHDGLLKSMITHTDAADVHRERLASGSEMFGEDTRERLLSIGSARSGIDYAAGIRWMERWQRQLTKLLSLAAAWWREPLLFRVGAAYQARTDWHLRRAPLLGEKD